MATEVLSIGFPVTMNQNQIYALPARRVSLFSQSGGTLEQSNTVGFSVLKAVTLDANNEVELAGAFLRCTSATIIIALRALS